MTKEPVIDRLVRRERILMLTGLSALCTLGWLYLATGAGLGMSAAETTHWALFPHRQAAVDAASTMAGMDMASTGPGWDMRMWMLMIAMWWIMMAAMMVPSAAPTILLYARVHRHAAARGPKQSGLAPTSAFLSGYMLVWLGFSAAAAISYWALERLGLISAINMSSQSRWLSAMVLIAAGLYQLTPLKNTCLSQCRAPVSFLSRHWRPGSLGALRLGAMHGAFCVGCCWMLMALLFVGGVMNFFWIAALAMLVLIEKLLPPGRWIGRGVGILLLAWGAATLIV